MATFRKRGDSWQVQIRRTGYPSLTKTFPSKAAASQWAHEQERNADLNGISASPADKKLCLYDLLAKYDSEVVIRKRGAKQERYKIDILKRSCLASLTLPKLTSATVAAYRDDRLKSVSSGTVRRELAILHHCLEIARREWGVSFSRNPVDEIQLPKPGTPRDRRLSEEDVARLHNALERARACVLRPMIELAIETGMRRGEIISLRRANIDFSLRLAWLPVTKNGWERHVPLSPRAMEILSSLPNRGDEFFPSHPRRFVRRGIASSREREYRIVRFHDLRHEAISRFFELGLSIPEVALISGHRDFKMLFRYTHLRPADVAKKLG